MPVGLLRGIYCIHILNRTNSDYIQFVILCFSLVVFKLIFFAQVCNKEYSSFICLDVAPFNHFDSCPRKLKSNSCLQPLPTIRQMPELSHPFG
jgi:hypothetical protein